MLRVVLMRDGTFKPEVSASSIEAPLHSYLVSPKRSSLLLFPQEYGLHPPHPSRRREKPSQATSTLNDVVSRKSHESGLDIPLASGWCNRRAHRSRKRPPTSKPLRTSPRELRGEYAFS